MMSEGCGEWWLIVDSEIPRFDHTLDRPGRVAPRDTNSTTIAAT